MSMTPQRERPVTRAQLDRLAEWSLRKPVIALMGEFSAGKSTLMNLLIGRDILPTQITATRMPPVWLRYGTAPAYRVDHAGRRHPVDFADRASIPVEDTRYVGLFCEAPILKRCDLIDTPGISDPNIKVGYWIRTIGYANAVMWCTHAGQAWRESERGAWETLPKRLRQTSILLVTRKDKIRTPEDLRKIDRRLERETTGLFNARMFVSLTSALRARAEDDAAGWEDSGAQRFFDMLDQVVDGVYMQRSFNLTRYVVAEGGEGPAADPVAQPVEAQVAETVAQPAEAPAVEAVVVPIAPEVPAPQAAMTVEVAEPAPSHAAPDLASRPDEPSADLPEVAAPEAPGTEAAETEAAPFPSGIVVPSLPEPVFANYRLKPHRTAPEKRVDLSEYQLGRGQDAGQRGTDPVPEVPAALVVPARSEEEVIHEIWENVRARYDMAQVPRLESAFRQLLGDAAGARPSHHPVA